MFIKRFHGGYALKEAIKNYFIKLGYSLCPQKKKVCCGSDSLNFFVVQIVSAFFCFLPPWNWHVQLTALSNPSSSAPCFQPWMPVGRVGTQERGYSQSPVFSVLFFCEVGISFAAIYPLGHRLLKMIAHVWELSVCQAQIYGFYLRLLSP